MTNLCFLIEIKVQLRLHFVIKNNIKVGTTISSHYWRGYKINEKASFKHQTVNYTYNFVDPTTDAHTQNIERLWGSAK